MAPRDETLSRVPGVDRLDAGEAEAISLAKEVSANAILMDERRGRQIALRHGLTVIRTLAVIELAAERRLLELRPILEALWKTSFRIPRSYLAAALERDALRKLNQEP